MELAKVIFFIDAKSEGNLKFLNLIYEMRKSRFFFRLIHTFFFTFYNVSDCPDEFNDLLHDKV